MDHTEPADAAVRRTIDREVELLTSAVNLVASGGARSTMVVGLRLTDVVVDIVRPLATRNGLVLEPLWGSDEGTADVRVFRERPSE